MVDSNEQSYKLKLQSTQFLRGTGLLDAYEDVIDRLVSTGWPSDKTVFEHAAYELLKWHSNHREEYANNAISNPGTAGLQTPARTREMSPPHNFLNESSVSIDQNSLRQVSPSKRAANVLKQTTN